MGILPDDAAHYDLARSLVGREKYASALRVLAEGFSPLVADPDAFAGLMAASYRGLGRELLAERVELRQIRRPD